MEFLAGLKIVFLSSLLVFFTTTLIGLVWFIVSATRSSLSRLERLKKQISKRGFKGKDYSIRGIDQAELQVLFAWLNRKNEFYTIENRLIDIHLGSYHIVIDHPVLVVFARKEEIKGKILPFSK